jgi:outer membrane protein OmpA-like peptidoglycan-associated protein
MKNVILTLLLFSSVVLQAQTIRERRGEKFYEQYAFSESIAQLESISNKSPKINRMLAQSYSNIENFTQAEKYWAQLAASDSSNADDIWQYCEVLKINNKHSEAMQWMETYASKKQGDSRAELALSNKDYIGQLMNDTKRFETINLDINSEQQDFGPAYYGDKMLFASSRESEKPVDRKWNWNGLPFLDVYMADTDSSGKLLNVESFSKEINKKFHEGPAVISSDSTTIFYTRSNYEGKDAKGVVKLKLYSATKKGDDWSQIEGFAFNSDDYSVGHAALSSDAKTLYFASDMPGGIGGIDIYKSIKNEDGTWGKPENLGKPINTEGNEMFPFYHKDGMLFFASNGLPGLGGLDVFMTKIENGNFSAPQNLGASLNSTYDDFSYVMNTDGTSGYFSSNKPGGKGSDDIYFFNVLEPFKAKKQLNGFAKDELDSIIAEVKVFLYDANNALIDSVITNEKGEYQFAVSDEGKFTVKGIKEAYREDQKMVDAAEINEDSSYDLVLKKLPEVSFYFLLTDEETKSKISGAQVIITEVKANNEMKFGTSENGDFYYDLEDKRVGDVAKYTINITKEGYFAKRAEVTVNFDHKGQYNLHEMVNLEIHEVVQDVSEMVKIEPINFDVNKYNIRPDAAIELEKIVQVMNQYPSMEVELGAHTDCRASAAYNQRLSNQRAVSSAEYIKQRITNPERIYGKGYGESQLKNKCECEGAIEVPCSEEEHAENRRTEFKIIKY